MTNSFCVKSLLAFAFCAPLALAGAAIQEEKQAGLYKQAAGPATVDAVATIVLKDAKRDKELQVRVSFPKDDGKYPVIVWSHGMYGSKDGYPPLVRHWVSHGYVVIQPTHSDSLSLDSEEERRKALAELKVDRVGDWQSRPRDVQFVLDSLDVLAERVPGLGGKMDAKRLGVGGHSYGAFTTQLVAGTTARLPGGRRSFADPRPSAFVVISGNGKTALLDEESFRQAKGPTLFISGTNDKGRNGEEAVWRKDAFEHASPGDKYLVWVDGAYHDFGGISGAPLAFRQRAGVRLGESNPAHVDLVRSATLAFWDTYLKNDTAAKHYLTKKEIEESKRAAAFAK